MANTSLELLLNITKYTGLFIATSSSIWGATNVVSKDVDGKKKLTKAGKVSIILTISGLLISIASNIIQDQSSSEKAKQAYLNEIKKTNKIILAGQPLTSLDFIMKFDESLCKKFHSYMEETDSEVSKEQEDAAQGEMAGTQNMAITLSSGLLPLFYASIHDSLPKTAENFLYLIGLDDDQNSVLSYGYLNNDLKLYSSVKSKKGEILSSTQKEKISAGISLGLPAYQAGAANISHPSFLKDSSTTSLNWNLDIASLWSCINKQHNEFPLNANLPNVLKIAILYDFSSLPFTSGNIATCANFRIWHGQNRMGEDGEELKNHIYKNSSIEIVPNHLSDQKVFYKLKNIYQKTVTDPTWDEENICKELLLVYERSDK